MKKYITIFLVCLIVGGGFWYLDKGDEAQAVVIDIYEAVEAENTVAIKDRFNHSDVLLRASTTEIVEELTSLLEVSGGLKGLELTSYTSDEINTLFRQKFGVNEDTTVVFQSLTTNDDPSGYVWIMERFDKRYYPITVEAYQLSDVLIKETDNEAESREEDSLNDEKELLQHEQNTQEEQQLQRDVILGHWSMENGQARELYLYELDNQRLKLELVGTETDWLLKGERLFIEAEGEINGQEINFTTDEGNSGVITYKDKSLHLISEASALTPFAGDYRFVTERKGEPVITVKNDFFHFYDLSFLDDVESVKEKLQADTYINETEYAPYLESERYNYSGEVYDDNIYSYSLNVPTADLLYFIQTMPFDLYTDDSNFYIVNNKVDELIKFSPFEDTVDEVTVLILAKDSLFDYWVDEGATYKIN